MSVGSCVMEPPSGLRRSIHPSIRRTPSTSFMIVKDFRRATTTMLHNHAQDLASRRPAIPGNGHSGTLRTSDCDAPQTHIDSGRAPAAKILHENENDQARRGPSIL